MAESTGQTGLLFDPPLDHQHNHHIQASAGADSSARLSASEEPLSLEEILADKIKAFIEHLFASEEAGELQGAKIERIGLSAKVEKDGAPRYISIPHWRREVE
jgi:hypothetical protein